MLVIVVTGRTSVQQNLAPEVAGLRAIVQVIGGTERFEDVIEPVQERYPVIEVASRKRPSGRKGGEKGGELRQRGRGGFFDEFLKPRRLKGGRGSSQLKFYHTSYIEMRVA